MARRISGNLSTKVGNDKLGQREGKSRRNAVEAFKEGMRWEEY